jgi:hypothetical protein
MNTNKFNWDKRVLDKIYSLFNEEEKSEDEYSFGGSPGMSSVGAIGGNTNKGMTLLGSNQTQERLEMIKANIKNKKSSDQYSENSTVINDWFKPKVSTMFKKSSPIGLASKVRKHKEYLKSLNSK